MGGTRSRRGARVTALVRARRDVRIKVTARWGFTVSVPASVATGRGSRSSAFEIAIEPTITTRAPLASFAISTGSAFSVSDITQLALPGHILLALSSSGFGGPLGFSLQYNALAKDLAGNLRGVAGLDLPFLG